MASRAAVVAETIAETGPSRYRRLDDADEIIDPKTYKAPKDEEQEDGKPIRPPIAGILRAGYSIRLGGPGDGILYGRKRVSLTEDMAKAHLHKFENRAQIEQWLGIPVSATGKMRDPVEDAVRRQRAQRRADGTASGDMRGLVREELARVLPDALDGFKEAMLAEIRSMLRNGTSDAGAGQAQDAPAKRGPGRPRKNS